MGFWDSSFGEALKFGIKWGVSTVAAGTLVAATGGLGAIAIGGAVAGEGYLIKKAAQECDNEFFEFVGDTILSTGIGTATGGLVGTESSSLASKGSEKALRTGIATAGTNGSKILINSWVYTKMAQYGYDIAGKSKSGFEAFLSFLHGKHKEEGTSYESQCPICNGKFSKYPPY
ncbi:14118_t:CDS:1 [Racocetra persica]|uniref:14118_t:CDS:1 n=1 Tax=Racocetra persica TaxID=160502 RepID=A0ACA9NZQ0_9GLOM|nr:14118_t:CDS:1 [Racocetra persica]